MAFQFNIFNGLVFKLEIKIGQIICQWRFALNFDTMTPCQQCCAVYVLIFKLIQVCKIVEGQRYSKRLNERQITALLKVTCQRPQERERDILQVCFLNGGWLSGHEIFLQGPQ